MRLINQIWVDKLPDIAVGCSGSHERNLRIPVGWLRKDELLGIADDEICCIALSGKGPIICLLCRRNDRSGVIFLVSQKPADRLLRRRNDRSSMVFLDTTKERGGSVAGYRPIRCDLPLTKEKNRGSIGPIRGGLPLTRRADEMEIWKRWRKCYDGDGCAPGLTTAASDRVWSLNKWI